MHGRSVLLMHGHTQLQAAIEHLAIPKFDPNNQIHKHLAALSKRCHMAAIKDDEETISRLEGEIDKFAAELWGLTDKELQVIQRTFDEIQKSKVDAAADDDEE